MSTFSEIYFNGNQYNQMWLNGEKIWEKDTGGSSEIVYPYDDADSVITYVNTSTSAVSKTFTVIDSSLPYSINGTSTTSFSFPASSETQVKLVNLKPFNSMYSLFPVKIEQLRIPKVTDLSFLFSHFGYSADYEYSWSPRYFEFSDNVTNMIYMFQYCYYLTDELMEQLLPYFPNTSSVTRMYHMFLYCQSLTKLDLSSLNISSGLTDMGHMFYGCKSLKELNLSSFDTHNVTSYDGTSNIFYNVKDCTIYVNENTWTLGTDSNLKNGTNLKFVALDDNGEVVPRPTGLLADFTTSKVMQLPVWMDEEARNSSYYFIHGTYFYDNTLYGLVDKHSTAGSSVYWTCYKIVAPTTGTLNITFRGACYSSYYGFTIHSTTSASQPSFDSSTNRILQVTGIAYRATDGVATLNVVQGQTYYIHLQTRLYSFNYGVCIRTIEFLSPISSIDLSYDVDLDNIEQEVFTVNPIIEPSNYDAKDLEIIYDSTYMSVNKNTFEIKLLNGCQGMSHTVTYRSKTDNSISKSITFYVSENLEIEEITLMDFTQSTAPTLPDYMTVDKNNTYSFSHGLYTTDVYGLIPSNKGKSSSTAYTRYKLVAPKTGILQFTYRCYAETNFDYLTVHVDTSTSQPSTTSATNQVFTTKDVSSYQNTDGTGNVLVVEGTTYYIHIQYYKDSSGNNGYDMGCIRTIRIV